MRDVLGQFWSHVDVRGPAACWEWQGSRYHDDYGMRGWRNQGRSGTMRAHAFALILATGEDQNGWFALHRCDNPPCCNPAHLYWGNQKQNIADMDQRGRARRPIRKGSANTNAKLVEQDVVHIRAAYASGRVSQQALADHYGVSQQVISVAISGKRWSHVP